jgi:glutamine cyclotransferase
MMHRRRPTALALLALCLAAAGCADDPREPVTAVDRPAASTTVVADSTTAPADPTTTEAPSTDAPSTQTPSTTAGDDGAAPAPLTGAYVAEVVTSVPHDTGAYTQGLEWYDGVLLESTGQYGASTLRRIDPTTGDVVDERVLDSTWFGEGLTVVGDQVWQLTWREGVLVRSTADDLDPIDTIGYTGEGWGLCLAEDRLVMSDGSNVLTFRDPATFEIVGTVAVDDANGPLALLNELECRGTQVLANIYGSDTIAVIDIETGTVSATIDASALRPAETPLENLDFVLNGIAARPGTDRYFLTGKYWPVLYEVELVPSGG